MTVEGIQSGLYNVYLRHGGVRPLVMPEDVDVGINIRSGDDFINVGMT